MSTLHSATYIMNSSAPITAAPFSVGMWVMAGATGATRTFWFLGSSAAATNRDCFLLRQNSTNVWHISVADSGAQTSAAAGTVTASQWFYVVGRFISATNYRIAVLQPDGSTAHAQGTISRTPASVDRSAVGIQAVATPTQGFTGQVAEYWLASGDIQADGAQLQDNVLRQLAYGGPFSVPHIVKDIIEYRSFRTYPSSEGDNLNEVFHGAAGRQTWANINGVTIGHHPPLPYWYEKPGQRRTTLTI